MREQPCRDAPAQHTPAVSTCAFRQVSWLAARLELVPSSRGIRLSDKGGTNPLRPTVAGAAPASSLALPRLQLSPDSLFIARKVRTVAPQDIGSRSAILSTYCGKRGSI